MKPPICIDFDGVINSYKSGYGPHWRVDVIPDPPTRFARQAIAGLRQKYRVIVQSTRCSDPKGKKAIEDWLRRWRIEVDDVVAEKPPAMMYVDDRAIPFDGDWRVTLDRIRNFKHWFLDDDWTQDEEETDECS